MKHLLLTIAALITLTIAAYGVASDWRREGPLVHPTCCLAAAAAPTGTIFTIGGTDVFDGPTTKVFRYRPGDDTWVAAPSLPQPRTGHAAAIGGDGRLYAIGGTDGHTRLASVVALRPGIGAAWVEVAPLPTPREDLGAAAGNNGKIYVVGGLTDHVVRALQIYDPATNKWKPGAPMLTPRRGMGVGPRGGWKDIRHRRVDSPGLEVGRSLRPSN
jgi:N-acetylneuraminic acid mutarotase